jgi:hypothetical protein
MAIEPSQWDISYWWDAQRLALTHADLYRVPVYVCVVDGSVNSPAVSRVGIRKNRGGTQP